MLNAVVARESNAGAMIRLVYERAMKDVSDDIASQRVKVDSSRGFARSAFEAAHSAADFVRDGFLSRTAEGDVFFGPDADVLLDDAFATAYCFHLERAA